nr:PREDICTED: M protein, serotype 5-like isoform X1 [Anolis carolinensis]|eukprot:XP_016849072.1 PREDICTED: M protein, serotype 5-like isoform X1 [Anolis carolinensis]
MAYRLRSERHTKEPKTMQKRASFSEEPQVKEMTEMILKELYRMQEKQDAYQKLAQDQMAEFKKEIKSELKGMKQEIGSLSQELKELKNDKEELRNSHGKLQREVQILEQKYNKIEAKQELLEAKDLEYQLRLRNVWEEPRENIRMVVTEILANLLQSTKEEIEDRVDRIYRINTNYAKRNKTSRDVIVNFTKKIYRDEILKLSNENTISFKEKRVIILKEFPMDTINRRRKYLFLVDELKRYNLRFRWEKEGLMTTYRGEKHWITSEGKAQNFYKKIKKEMEEEEERDHAERMRKKKSRRKKYTTPQGREEVDREQQPREEQLISLCLPFQLVGFLCISKKRYTYSFQTQ